MKDIFMGRFELGVAIFCFIFIGWVGNEFLTRDFNPFYLLFLIPIFLYGILALYAGVENLK